MQKTVCLGLVISLVGIILLTPIAQGEEPMITSGKTVKIDYTLTVDGQIVDSSEGKEPLEYTHGQGMLIPGLEKELEGMKAGEAKDVMVAPTDGYGEVSQDALREVPRTQFPPNITPEVGQRLSMQGPQGQQIPVSVTEVKEDVVVLDFNHPLAGKELNFNVTVVSVN